MKVPSTAAVAFPRPSLMKDALGHLDADPLARPVAIEAFLNIGRNVLEHINEPGRFGHIRKSQPVFMDKIGKLPGHADCMRALGFDDKADPELWSWSSSLAQMTQDSMQIL